MHFSCEIYILSTDRELSEVVNDYIVEQTKALDKSESPNIIMKDGDSYFFTWYWYSHMIDNTSDLAYCEESEWETILEKCALLLVDKGAVIIRFWNHDNPQMDTSFAYTSPYGITGGKGSMPDDWVVGFEDEDMCEDIINVSEMICPKEFLYGISSSTYHKAIKLDDAFQKKVKGKYHTSKATKTDDSYWDSLDDDLEGLVFEEE